jgi:hypothetical protein
MSLTFVQPASANQDLTEEQQQQIASSAALLGYTPDQIATILANPTLYSSIPVGAETAITERVIPTPGKLDAPNPGGQTFESVTPADIAPDLTLANFAPGCRERHESVQMLNIYRARLWAFNMKKYWCWDGYRVIQAPNPQIWGSVTAAGGIGWTYQGVIGSDNQYRGSWEHVSWAQGKFVNCTFKIGCIQSNYPTLTIRAYGNGTYATR